MNFKAIVVEEKENGFSQEIKTIHTSDLPEGEVLIESYYSSLNYKDALSYSGNKGVTKKYPHIPGIDVAGKVVESSHPAIGVNSSVIVTGYDLGMNTFGGFGQYVRVPSDWVVPLPESLTLKEAMAYGTAGFTAAMSVYQIINKIRPEDGEIFVTGSTGGVGLFSIAILKHLGYDVCALTGKKDKEKFLKDIGAKKVLFRDDFLSEKDRPLMKPLFAGVIDAVGGEILSRSIRMTQPLGVVACCGNASSFDLPLNVFPFILRGVSLIGIDSQNCPMPHRLKIWENLSTHWKPPTLDSICKEIDLPELMNTIPLMLKGNITGRYLINLRK